MQAFGESVNVCNKYESFPKRQFVCRELSHKDSYIVFNLGGKERELTRQTV